MRSVAEALWQVIYESALPDSDWYTSEADARCIIYDPRTYTVFRRSRYIFFHNYDEWSLQFNKKMLQLAVNKEICYYDKFVFDIICN